MSNVFRVISAIIHTTLGLSVKCGFTANSLYATSGMKKSLFFSLSYYDIMPLYDYTVHGAGKNLYAIICLLSCFGFASPMHAVGLHLRKTLSTAATLKGKEWRNITNSDASIQDTRGH